MTVSRLRTSWLKAQMLTLPSLFGLRSKQVSQKARRRKESLPCFRCGKVPLKVLWMMNHNQDYILEQCSFSANRDKEGDEEWVLPRKEEGDAMSTEGMDAADVARTRKRKREEDVKVGKNLKKRTSLF